MQCGKRLFKKTHRFFHKHKKYSLRPSVEQVKVPELEPHPLSVLPYELVGALHVLRVGARVRRRHDLAHPPRLGVDDEGAGLPLGGGHVRQRGAQVVAVWKKGGIKE